jgi:hypothetical protein
MKSWPRITFVFRTNPRHPEREGTVLCRVTVDKKNKEFTSGVLVLRENWDTKGQRVRGLSTAVKQANEALVKTRDRINDLVTLTAVGALLPLTVCVNFIKTMVPPCRC